jgi:hypothetical protein
MKVTIKTPEPVKPAIVVEMTQHEALIVMRVMSRVLVHGPEGNVTYELFSKLDHVVVADRLTVAPPRSADISRWPCGYLTFEKENDK